MGIKHLQVAVWATGLVFSVVDAAAQISSVCDSGLVSADCRAHCDDIQECVASGAGSCIDKVEALDHCLGIETILATGTDDDDDDDFLNVNVSRVTSTIIGGFPVLETLGVLSFPYHSDEDGDGIYDDDDLCDDESGEEGFHGCKAKTYCLEIDETYSRACIGWASRNLSTAELGGYYQGLRDFAEGGCGGDESHWACFGVYNLQPINWNDVGQTLGDYVADTYGSGVVAPQCPSGFAPQLMHDYSGYGLSLYSGSCVNICRQSLFHAGLLTSVAGSAGAIAATAAGRTALANGLAGAAGAGGGAMSVDQLIPFCDGPTWVEPVD